MAGKRIHIDYLARVEGETAIEVEIGGAQPPVRLKIFEPPRFFEGFLVGRRYDEVGDIVSRICGICPVSHMTTAILALEKAMGVRVSQETRRLRHISTISQIVASHLVHLYALALPDYVGREGLPQMLPAFPEAVGRLIRMRQVMNDLTGLVAGGRALHPIGTVVGGFTRVPAAQELTRVRERLVSLRDDAAEVVRTVARFSVPDLRRPREFAGLLSTEGYAINEGEIVSTQGLRCTVEKYRDVFQEEQVPYAMAKRTTIRGRGSLMSGALARMNLKHDRLDPATQALAREVGFAPPDTNPFHNNLAQALEIVQGIEDCISLLQGLDPSDQPPAIKVNPGEGAAITEAPRGLLYHAYAVNRNGIVSHADIVTPTAHNFLCIEEDLRALVNLLPDRPADEIRQACEMLVRAYDPCFSCSVH